jgi:hypothetical protein
LTPPPPHSDTIGRACGFGELTGETWGGDEDDVDHIGVITGVIILRKDTAWSDGFWEHVWHHGKRGRRMWHDGTGTGRVWQQGS